MYLLTHSLSPVLVPVAVMNPKVLKTKISHTHSLILTLLLSMILSHSASQTSVCLLQCAASFCQSAALLVSLTIALVACQDPLMILLYARIHSFH